MHPQLPLLAGFGDDIKAFDQAFGLPDLGGLLLRRLGAQVTADLVVVAGLAPGVAHPLVHPGPLGPGPVGQRVTALRVILVGFAGVPAGHLALVEVRLVATAEEADLLLGEVQFADGGDGAGEKLPVMADHHHTRP